MASKQAIMQLYVVIGNGNCQLARARSKGKGLYIMSAQYRYRLVLEQWLQRSRICEGGGEGDDCWAGRDGRATTTHTKIRIRGELQNGGWESESTPAARLIAQVRQFTKSSLSAPV